MKRVRNLLLCLVLLALAGILHHEWLQMSGSSGMATSASAATLSNGSGQACSGTGTWHFVNNKTQGQCGPLTAEFTCDGNDVQQTVNPTACLNSTDHYFVQTTGSCSLVGASTGSQPGRLVLSNFDCVPGPTPTPTPTPTP
jgi:hypothetical protein